MIADSFVVTWQFGLRYGSETVPLGCPSHSLVRIDMDGARAHAGRRRVAYLIARAGDRVKGATIEFFRRKGCGNPDPVVRECVCRRQGRRMCGVCALARRAVPAERVFPGLTYADGLAWVKVTATQVNAERPLEWGTHAFRRGRADQVACASLTARGARTCMIPGPPDGRPPSALPHWGLAVEGRIRVCGGQNQGSVRCC